MSEDKLKQNAIKQIEDNKPEGSETISLELYNDLVCTYIDEAREEERKRCAKIAESLQAGECCDGWGLCPLPLEIAKKIRKEK